MEGFSKARQMTISTQPAPGVTSQAWSNLTWVADPGAYGMDAGGSCSDGDGHGTQGL